MSILIIGLILITVGSGLVIYDYMVNKKKRGKLIAAGYCLILFGMLGVWYGGCVNADL